MVICIVPVKCRHGAVDHPVELGVENAFANLAGLNVSDNAISLRVLVAFGGTRAIGPEMDLAAVLGTIEARDS